MSVWIILAILLVTVLCPRAGWSVEPWLPPVVELISDQNQVLIAVVEQIQLPDQVHWRRVEVVQGAPPEQFSTRLDTGQTDRVTTGRKYLVAITTYRRHSMFREGLEVDPSGPRIVEIPGVGTAILPSVPELRRVLDSAIEGVSDSSAYLSDLHELMSSRSPEVRRLALLEILLRPEILSRANQDTVAGMRSILAQSAIDWAELELILTVGRKLTVPLQDEWLLEESQRVLRESPVQLDLASSRPALVETALRILTTLGTAADGGLAIRHFASNSPGVVAQSTETVEVLDCPAGLDPARAILRSSTDLHLQSRQSLEEFISRRCDAH